MMVNDTSAVMSFAMGALCLLMGRVRAHWLKRAYFDTVWPWMAVVFAVQGCAWLLIKLLP